MRSNQLKIPGLALTCCLLIQLAGFAQKRNNVWMFGSKGGLNFNTTPVTPLNTNPNTIKFPNTISSISDTAGNLVFYTDGIAIWDRYHRKLDKRYTGWPWGDYVVPESFHPYNVPLLVPYIGNDSLYYLFGVSNGGPWPKNLQYLTLNSKMYAERGGIVYPEPSTPVNYFTSLLTNALPLLAGTHHCNRKDIWITTYKENAFYSFLVTAAGVSSTPVISSLPSAAGKPDTVRKYNIKFSANGEKIVFPMIDKNRILVMDFNNLTGEFNDPAIFNMEPGETLEDVELSPDGSKLYYGSYVIDPESGIELHNISQVDLEAGTPEQMRQSTAMLTAFPDRAGCTPRTCFYVYRTLQLGPDGKIYASMRSNFPFASVIEEPNEKGTQARYMFSGFNMKREYVHMSMNYIRSFSYSAKENGIQAKKANCADLPVDFSLLYERADSVKWDFGDAASGAANYSTALNAQHRFTTP
ncbi:MAG: hypothetical protein K0Q66_2100, partial [Chitinophagaceae bacterium]|nr:hypothetical protein [Chitinophagaceae bacterium]